MRRRRPKKFRKDLRGSYRINHQIRVREVRLIGADREHFGVVSIREALERAREASLDLVEISPNAEPPVARIMDYGRFIYEQAKKERETRKTQKLVEVKEFRLRPRTNEHDREIKMDQARKWLEDGMKVKVRIRFRGREITYPELAHGQLLEVAQELADVALVEQEPNLEGQTMLMILAPKKGAGAPVRGEGEEDLEDEDLEDQEDLEDEEDEDEDEEEGEEEESAEDQDA